MTFTITIDGPAGAGKGTLARALATHYNLALLETGLLYRCVGLKALAQGLDLAQENQLVPLCETLTAQDLLTPNLRSPEASDASSRIGVHPKVRLALFKFQQDFAKFPPSPFAGSVLDGRDTGTVICPDAPVKFFITASIEIRAERRFKELQARGIESIYSSVFQDMIERDTRDSQRAESPLQAASEALIIDTSSISPEDVLAQAIAFVEMHRFNFKK